MKCINDARGLNLCSGKKVKNNVTMEPDGTISINSEARLFSLTQAGRPSLSEIEYFMDYGEAYFEKSISGGGGGNGVVAQVTSEDDDFKEMPKEKKTKMSEEKETKMSEENEVKDAIEQEKVSGAGGLVPDGAAAEPAASGMRTRDGKRGQEPMINLLSRAERLEERQKRVKNAEADMPRKPVKARSLGLQIVPLEARVELALNLEKETGLKVISIKDDNNCVFRALAHLVFEGDDEAHTVIRDAVCNELEVDPGGVYSERFTPRIGDYREDGSYAQHVTRMRRLEEWGGEPELRAAASIFGFQIHVYHPFFHDGVQVIQAPVKKHVEKEEVDVHLLYYGDHYDVAYHVSRPFDPESRKRRKLKEPAENGEGHSTVGHGDEDDDAVATSSVMDVAACGEASAAAPGPAGRQEAVVRRYKRRGESVMGGNRLSSEIPNSSADHANQSKTRLPFMGLSKTR